MRTSLIVKINFLLLGLGLTAYFMYFLNNRGLPAPLLSFFGITSSHHSTQHIDWCQTRVEAIIRPQKFKLQQEGRIWQIEADTARVADFVSVEKWFGRNCRLKVTNLESVKVEQSQVSPELFVKFIDGQVEVLKRLAAGVYEWKGQIFSSKQMDQALTELETLPTSAKP